MKPKNWSDFQKCDLPQTDFFMSKLISLINLSSLVILMSPLILVTSWITFSNVSHIGFTSSSFFFGFSFRNAFNSSVIQVFYLLKNM